MNTTEDILKEFDKQFSNELSAFAWQNVARFIQTALVIVRQETAKEIMEYGEQTIGYKCCKNDLFYKYAKRIKANKPAKDINVPTKDMSTTPKDMPSEK